MFMNARSFTPTPSPFFRYRPGPRAILIICLHTPGCYRPVHIVHNVQFTAFPGHLVRHWHQNEALLYVYGVFDIALAKALAYCLGIDTFPWNRRSAVGGLRRLHQSQDREKHLRLRDDLWSCRQSQSKLVSVGTKLGRGRLTEASQRSLGVFVFRFSILLRQAYHWCGKGDRQNQRRGRAFSD